MSEERIVICDKCVGCGIVYWNELVDYHKGDYDTHSKDCERCKGRGVLVKITTVKMRALEAREYKPARTHNGKTTPYKWES